MPALVGRGWVVVGMVPRVVGLRQVTTRTKEGQAITVPVSWPEAPAEALLDAGAEVVVAGRVQRRYFRAGGATQSRTEVVAEAVVPATARRRAHALVERALRGVEV